MQDTWKPDPVARFWERLIRERAMEYVHDPKWLKTLRYDNKEAMKMQKRFGAVWDEYGTDVYKLIAEAHNETWNLEDEEKHAPALQVAARNRVPAPLWEKKESTVNQRNDDDLAPARQASSRERIDQLQGKPEESECVVEKEEGISLKRGGISLGPEKEEAPQEKESGARRRREGFYRLAGGT